MYLPKIHIPNLTNNNEDEINGLESLKVITSSDNGRNNAKVNIPKRKGNAQEDRKTDGKKRIPKLTKNLKDISFNDNGKENTKINIPKFGNNDENELIGLQVGKKKNIFQNGHLPKSTKKGDELNLFYSDQNKQFEGLKVLSNKKSPKKSKKEPFDYIGDYDKDETTSQSEQTTSHDDENGTNYEVEEAVSYDDEENDSQEYQDNEELFDDTTVLPKEPTTTHTKDEIETTRIFPDNNKEDFDDTTMTPKETTILTKDESEITTIFQDDQTLKIKTIDLDYLHPETITELIPPELDDINILDLARDIASESSIPPDCFNQCRGICVCISIFK